MKPEDRAACLIAASLLARGATLHRLAVILAVLALLAAASLAELHPQAAAYGVFAAGLAALILLCETYLALRTAFDADLFRGLATGALDLATLDAGLQRVYALPAEKLGRPLDQRLDGARRLLKLQAACLFILTAAAAIIIVAIALHAGATAVARPR